MVNIHRDIKMIRLPVRIVTRIKHRYLICISLAMLTTLGFLGYGVNLKNYDKSGDIRISPRINPRAKMIPCTFIERETLEVNETFFHPEKKVISPYNVTFLLKSESICEMSSPFLLVMVPTVASNRKSRDIIRQTWGSVATKQTWPHRDVNGVVKVVFLLGLFTSKNEFETAKDENKQHNDLVMADFTDSYRNLSRKILTGLYWMETYCPSAKYVLKCDDDTFVNIPLLIDLLISIEPRIKLSAIGHIHGKSKVVRYGRWNVPKFAYPLDIFPRYSAGGAYVLPRELAARILHVSQYLVTVPVEDAYIGGILTRAAGGTHIHCPLFTRYGDKPPKPCEFLEDSRLACTRASEMLESIWKSFVTNSCEGNLSL